MERTGKFITAAELESLNVAQKVSGMFLSGGMPMSDPGRLCAELGEKYEMRGCAIDPTNGEFVRP